IVARFAEETKDADTVLIEGLVPTRKQSFANNVNFDIAKALDAEIVFVVAPGTDTPEELKERLEVACSNFGGLKNKSIAGVIVNKLNAPVDEMGRTRPDLSEIFDDSNKAKSVNVEVL
ncbi:AAA family ATPase, partial [Vibrio cholerae]|nr:AAA family ATPase [Vibrio cholerae]